MTKRGIDFTRFDYKGDFGGRQCKGRSGKKNGAWKMEELILMARASGMPYSHFKKKDDLCDALMRPWKTIEPLQPRSVSSKKSKAPPTIVPPVISKRENKGVKFGRFVNCADSSIVRHSHGDFPNDKLLKPHQAEVVKRILRDDCNGLLLFFEVGSGKTLASIAAVEAVMACDDSVKGAVVVAPASLLDNYRNEIESTKANKSKYKLLSFEMAAKQDPSIAQNKVLIIDEAHRLKNSSGKMAAAAKALASNAVKVILLTGSPIQNMPYELGPLVSLIPGVNLPVSRMGFESRYGVSGMRGDIFGALKGKILYYRPPDDDNYPSLEFDDVYVEMSDAQASAHEEATKKLERRMGVADLTNMSLSDASLTFYSGPRRISNCVRDGQTLWAPKLRAVASRVSTYAKKNEKSLVFSFFLDRGLEPIMQLLKEAGVTFSVVSGKQTAALKAKAVKDFNDDKVQAILLSDAGSEGLDLKHCRHVHIVEPRWNEQQIAQVIGRARRYKSHTRPDVKKTVNVHRYYSLMNSELADVAGDTVNIRNTSADIVIKRISEAKNAICAEFLAALIHEIKEEYESVSAYDNWNDGVIPLHSIKEEPVEYGPETEASRLLYRTGRREAMVVRIKSNGNCLYYAVTACVIGQADPDEGEIGNRILRQQTADEIESNSERYSRFCDIKETVKRIKTNRTFSEWVDINALATHLKINIHILSIDSYRNYQQIPKDKWIDLVEFIEIFKNLKANVASTEKLRRRRSMFLINVQNDHFDAVLFQ